ncbi:alpha/beta-hydrolase [Myriangium duriaei CBS 260.36]|uniref:Alpha/beta-hydrolase n=1 Tax=Myriangium duriaei CBS 260.36 TaxID=1168546 RepID=A0A9P4J6X0_9PEZI|nr:alpha/beta-hydrolase [Myriangium duriaei CBS 260.36]
MRSRAFFPIRVLVGINVLTLGHCAADGFAWDSLETQKQLSFQPCYHGFQCSRLDLPLDWSTPDSSDRISLAVIKLPARVTATDARYGGSIIVNPGGPGGSGVRHVLSNGRSIQQTVDADGELRDGQDAASTGRYFDIVSFDPRGVANTSPAMDCFPSNYANAVWEAQMLGDGIMGSSDVAFDNNWARMQALGKACSWSKSPIIPHMHTAAVCNDMRELIVRLEAERSDQGPETSVQRHHHQSQQPLTVVSKAKMQYWGQSYGTLLGMTFATMFPDHIDRMVLDGVVDGQDYYAGDWARWLVDADAVMQSFFEYCSSRGPEKCAFYRGSKWQDIASSLRDLLDTIRTDPVVVEPLNSSGPDIITHGDVMRLIRVSTYYPEEKFDQMATLLNDVDVRNGSLFSRHKSDMDNLCVAEGDQFNVTWPCPRDFEDHARLGVLCTDGPDFSNVTKADFKEKAYALTALTKWFAPTAALMAMACPSWNARGVGKFQGHIGGNTSHPILLVSPTLDPATPLRHAHLTSRVFPGSVVLEQNSIGHCSTSVASDCTVSKIREYFQTGKLPERGTICPPNDKSFMARRISGT